MPVAPQTEILGLQYLRSRRYHGRAVGVSSIPTPVVGTPAVGALELWMSIREEA